MQLIQWASNNMVITLLGVGVVIALLMLFFYLDYRRACRKQTALRNLQPRLFDCPDCKEPVSRAAFNCPHCGRPIREAAAQTRQQSVAGGVFLGLILFFIVLPIVIWLTCFGGLFTFSR